MLNIAQVQDPLRYSMGVADPNNGGNISSPGITWWCVRNGHHDRARQSLRRLARRVGFDQETEDRQLAHKF